MRRALFVAGDRLVTRSQAEALMERDIDAPPSPDADWMASRAHSALEAKALIEHGRRPFDVVVIAPRLPDGDGVDLIADLRKLDETREVPLFLMTERGRDTHSRRIAAARYRLAGFIELPATAPQVRAALDGVRRRRRVLVVEPRSALAERYRVAFERAGFVPDICPLMEDATARRRSFDPDLVAVALAGPNDKDWPGPDGLEVCARLKRLDAAPKVLLYGPLASLESRRIDANTERADDFVKAPFDDELLAERAAALVGLGAPVGRGKPPLARRGTADDEPDTRVSPIDLPPLAQAQRVRKAPSRQTSPLPRPTPRRESRRVPCDVTLAVEGDGRTVHARTLDISPGGMFFAADPPFSSGARLRMEFVLPDESEAIHAEGRVAWVGHGPRGAAGMGVEFARVDVQDLQTIIDYVNRLSGVLYEAG